MKLTVSHRITTRFDPPRRRLLQSIRVFPTNCASQQTTSWQISAGDGETGAEFIDGAGDQITTISTPGEITEQTLEITGEVTTVDTLGVLRDVKEKVPAWAYMTTSRLIRPDAAITAMAKEAIAGIPEEKGLDRAHGLSKGVAEALSLSEDPTGVAATASESLDRGEGGICDIAHVLIAAAHAVNMPARFVYGYLVRDTVDLESELGEDDDNGALVMSAWPGHAWVEIWVEGFGWVGFDAVEECCPDERYIRLCSGRDGEDAAPLRATAIGQGGEAIEVSLDVREAEQ